MVGVVVVSHSEKLAEGVIHFTKMSAPNALTAYAGGLEDGSYGTSYDRILEAIQSVYSEDGVVILCDLGSSVMTTEMVLEMNDFHKVQLIGCPLVEGAFQATISSENGLTFEEIVDQLNEITNHFEKM